MGTGQSGHAGELALKSSRFSLSTFKKLLGIGDLLFARFHGVPCLCDVRVIRCFLGRAFAMKGFHVLQQMLLKLAEALVQPLQVGFNLGDSLL
jgi:hypothetical protein